MRLHHGQPLRRRHAILFIQLVQFADDRRVAAKLNGLFQSSQRLLALIALARVNHGQIAVDDREIRAKRG